MKNMTTLAAAFVALAGWSNVLALDLPKLCGDYKFLNNPDTRVYRGEFTNNNGSLDHALVVVEVTNTGRALVFYVHGTEPAWKIRRTGCNPYNGTIEDDILTIDLPYRVKVTYVFKEGGEVSVKYVSRSKDGGKRTTRGKLMLVK